MLRTCPVNPNFNFIYLNPSTWSRPVQGAGKLITCIALWSRPDNLTLKDLSLFQLKIHQDLFPNQELCDPANSTSAAREGS